MQSGAGIIHRSPTMFDLDGQIYELELRMAQRVVGAFIDADARIRSPPSDGRAAEDDEMRTKSSLKVSGQVGDRAVAGDTSPEGEHRFQRLVHGITDCGISMLDPAGRVASWNLGAERMTGYLAHEAVGQHVSLFSTPEDRKAGLPARALETASHGVHVEGESWRIRKDGSRFWASVVLDPIYDKAGMLLGIAEVTRDNTERDQAEDALDHARGRAQHSQELRLLEAAPDAMVVVNQAGEIVLLNLQAEKRFGYRRHELIGQPVTNIIPRGFAERLISDETRSAAEALAQQIGTGIELLGLRKDGSEFPIEIMLSPLDSADGILVIAAIRDISVRRAAEENLARMEARYRGLLEAAPDAMVVVNQAGDIVLVNVQAEKQFGYPRDELIGQPVTNIVPEGFAERLIADRLRSQEDALAQEIGAGIELSGRRKAGSVFPIEIMLSPLENADGLLITAAIRDISVRKKAEAHDRENTAELRRSNQDLAQFAYIASHDLQEPLRMVASYTQLLSKRYKGKLDSDADEFIAFAVDGAARMQRLIQDLLTYSRVGTKGVHLQEVSSERALLRALGNLSAAISESGAVVTHGDLPAVQGDSSQLVQLFQNLVGNAIKYRTAGIPHIHVSAEAGQDGEILFSVKDDGLGIEPRYFERIFGMFQRLHKREEFSGTGIGLAICKKIVERHGGCISVVSEPGRGSTFRFSLKVGKPA